MDIDDYATWAAANAGRRPPLETGDESAPEPVRPQHESRSARRERLAYLGLGLAGESGEVVELIKKYLRNDLWPTDRVSDELGDVAYYWACLCVANGRTPSEILDESVAKIEAKRAGSRTKSQ